MSTNIKNRKFYCNAILQLHKQSFQNKTNVITFIAHDSSIEKKLYYARSRLNGRADN